jgi:hypothetical protein
MSSGLAKAYQAAGANFLALKLGKLFTRIESVEDQALHNDMLADVLSIIEGNEASFFKQIAENMLYHKPEKKKRFLYQVACRVLMFGQKKG